MSKSISDELRNIFAEYRLGFQVPPDMDIEKHLENYQQAILNLIERERERAFNEYNDFLTEQMKTAKLLFGLKKSQE